MIQAGRVDLLPKLWEQVQAFVRKQAAKWLAAWRHRRPSLEFDDLYQCGFLALCEAVTTYRADKQMQFLGWLLNYLRTEFAIEVGCRTQTQRFDPLSTAASLDAPIGQDGLILADAVADPAGCYEDIERQIYRQQLHDAMQAALDKLPDKLREALALRYYDGMTLKEAAEKLHVASENIRRREQKSFCKLRKDIALREMWYGSRNLYNHTGVCAWKQTRCSAQEWEIIKKEQWERRLAESRTS